MTLTNDKRNRFERIYTKKFEEIAAAYGIGIDYEGDRAALDFGLHLTIPGSKFEGVTARRVSIKGQSTGTLATEKFDKKDDFSQQVEIEHLRQWYRYAEPVYLVVYLECVDAALAQGGGPHPVLCLDEFEELSVRPCRVYPRFLPHPSRMRPTRSMGT